LAITSFFPESGFSLAGNCSKAQIVFKYSPVPELCQNPRLKKKNMHFNNIQSNQNKSGQTIQAFTLNQPQPA